MEDYLPVCVFRIMVAQEELEDLPMSSCYGSMDGVDSCLSICPVDISAGSDEQLDRFPMAALGSVHHYLDTKAAGR